MDVNLDNFLKSFNRYFLRYGPNTAITIALSLKYGFCINADSKAMFVFLCAAIGYLFTWPMLLLHLFRFHSRDIKSLSEWRDKNKDAEFVETVRHGREYGNALACAGFTLIQFPMLVNYAHSIDSSDLKINFFIGGSLVFVGLISWFRALRLESLQDGGKAINYCALISVGITGAMLIIFLYWKTVLYK